jgi:uncharacterized protein
VRAGLRLGRLPPARGGGEWDELAYGSIGAVVLADTRRLADCFAAVDYFEQRRTPFVIAVNQFGGPPGYTREEVQDALDLDPGTPVVLCDARQRDSVKQVLVTLVRHTIGLGRSVAGRA